MESNKKYYLVPADVMESNFPDDFAEGIYPGEQLGVINLDHYNDKDMRRVTNAQELAVAIFTKHNW